MYVLGAVKMGQKRESCSKIYRIPYKVFVCVESLFVLRGQSKVIL